MVICIAVLIVFVAPSVYVVAAESSTAKPVVPAFTAKLVDRSYNVPAASSVDSYTGQTLTTPAHRVENYTIDVTIQKPGFLSGGDTGGFCYNVRVKGHFGVDWFNFYRIGEGPKLSNYSNSVTLTYILDLITPENEPAYPSRNNDLVTSANSISEVPPNSQLDFQVEAMTGYWTRTIQFDSEHFVAQESGWSNTQTVTIPGNSPTPSPNNYVSPTQAMPTVNTGPIINTYLGLDYGEVIIIAILAVIAVLLVILIMVIHQRKPTKQQQDSVCNTVK